jgi:Zn-dependent peptidase ImmA (M78 family)
LSPSKALLLLSFRYRSDDHFWFTFFHEAGHLLLHNDSDLFLEEELSTIPESTKETEANAFAAEILVPATERHEMHRLQRDTRQIVGFARRIGVSPGVVVGQMQHAGVLRYEQMNHLKRRFAWDEFSNLEMP